MFNISVRTFHPDEFSTKRFSPSCTFDSHGGFVERASKARLRVCVLHHDIAISLLLIHTSVCVCPYYVRACIRQPACPRAPRFYEQSTLFRATLSSVSKRLRTACSAFGTDFVTAISSSISSTPVSLLLLLLLSPSPSYRFLLPPSSVI